MGGGFGGGMGPMGPMGGYGGMGGMGGMGGLGGMLNGGNPMALMALMGQGGGDSSNGVLGQLGMGNLLGAVGGMGLNAMGGDMNGMLMGNMLGMGGEDPNTETQNAAALHGLDPDDMDGDGVADHLKETSNRIDDYLAKQWLLGKRKLTVSVNYGNIPLEYQYLQQYHGMPNPLSGTPLGPKFGRRGGLAFGPHRHQVGR